MKRAKKMKFMPFWIAGYPTIKDSITSINLLLNYCDVLEIGIPFSDPIADGDLIQNANNVAIKSGFTTDDVFFCLENLLNPKNKPIIILCYLNTILQYGVGKFFQKLSTLKISGIVIPDLPPEEVDILENFNKIYSVNISYTISTNTSPERIKYIDEISNSFIYFISKPAITGVNNNLLDQSTIDKISEIKDIAKNEIYIGFGISNKSHIKQLLDTDIDGFIVGSKLIASQSPTELQNLLEGFAGSVK
jgi:tryptophan synthase alpha chain